jgi:4'-phosphopantetheinyl transferase
LQFDKGIHGRPYVIAPHDATSLCFNLSHARGLVGVAVSTAPIGLDIEYIDRGIDPVEIFEDILTAAEIQPLLALDPAQMRRRFFRLWTLKEAYLKAIGAGFSVEPRSFSFELTEDHLTFHPPAHDATAWNFYSEFFDGTRCVAACYASCDDVVQIHNGRPLLLGAVSNSGSALRASA